MDNITLAKNIIKYLLADKTIKKFNKKRMVFSSN